MSAIVFLSCRALNLRFSVSSFNMEKFPRPSRLLHQLIVRLDRLEGFDEYRLPVALAPCTRPARRAAAGAPE
jgi:hypothetical protein